MGLGKKLGAVRRATEAAIVSGKGNEEPCVVRPIGRIAVDFSEKRLHATGGQPAAREDHNCAGGNDTHSFHGSLPLVIFVAESCSRHTAKRTRHAHQAIKQSHTAAGSIETTVQATETPLQQNDATVRFLPASSASLVNCARSAFAFASAASFRS